ncbi:hypothetical protein Tco_0364835 [Tanacetum coccineum]
MTVGQTKPENQWTEDERKAAKLDQRLKSMIMAVLLDDQMNSVINYLTAKSTWDDLILYHKGPSDVKESRNTNHVKDSEIASLFGKLKYEENLIDNIYGTENNKSLVSATPLSTAFFSSPIVPGKNLQDSHHSDDERRNTRSSQEYLNDLKEEYQTRALLKKSKRFFKKVTQSSSQHKPELRPTKYFKAKYNKVKAKLALLSSSSSASKVSMVKNKGLIAEANEWDEEEVSSDNNEMVEVKVLMALAEENDIADDTKVTILGVERPRLSEAECFILPNHDTDESSVCSTPLPPLKKLDGAEPISGLKTIKSILSSSALKVHSAHAGKLKNVKIEDDPFLSIVMKELNNLRLQVSKNQSSHSKNDQCERTDHRTCDHAEYIYTMNMSQRLKSLGRMSSRPNIPRPSKRFFPPCIHCGGIDYLSNECLYYPICKICGSYDHDTNGHIRILSLESEINPRNPQHAFKKCEACGSPNHTTTDHYDIEWFKRGEAL